MGCCISQVPHQSVSIIEQWGAFKRLASPGLLILNCPCGESVRGNISLRVQQLDVRCETKTQDNVFVTLTCSVQFQVDNGHIYDAFYRLTNPHQQITAYVFDVVRASVPKMGLDMVFEQKDEIAHAVKNELAKSMAGFGYEIIQALITDIDPDERVKKSMNEINAAQRMRVAAQDKAEAEKILQVKSAEADAESKFLSGVGIARQRKAIIEGLRDSVVEFSENIEGSTPKDVMDMVLVTQYFDTLKELGQHGRSNTVFVPHSTGPNSSLSDQIRTGFMEGKATHG